MTTVPISQLNSMKKQKAYAWSCFYNKEIELVCQDCIQDGDSSDEDDDVPEHDICCGCGCYKDDGRVCGCGCSHREYCEACKEKN